MNKTIQDGLYAAFDLGTASLKASIIEVSKSTPRLALIEEDSLKPAGDFPGEDEYRVHLIETLQNLSSRLPMKDCRKVSVLFSNREMQVKIIELPGQVQADQVEKILNWEAKKLLSPAFRDEPFAFSYRIVKQNPYSVALAVIPQRLLERFIELYDAAGISVDAVYAEVFASHSLNDAVDHTGLPALSIVNFGHSGTHLQIFSAGELRFYRFIPSGLGEMSQPPKESELEMYSQKIRFSFDYFRAVSKLSQIDAVFFMGGGAAQPNILPFERNYFNPTRINIVDISSYIDISPILPEISDNSPAEEKQRRLLPFLPAVGTILSMFSENSDRMNFALRLKKKKQEKRLQELSKTLPFVIAAGGTLLIIILLFMMKSSLNKELSDLNRQLEIARIDSDAVNLKIAKYKSAADTGVKLSPAARKALQPVLADQLTMAEVLYHLASGKPENLSISEVLVKSVYEAESINIEKEANLDNYSGMMTELDSQEETNQFISRLAADSGGTDQYTEGLGGKILIIRGMASENKSVAQLTRHLADKKVFARLKAVKTLKKSNRQIEFLVKGEMP
jgi:Tfp pilus assembly PilM family ATPase